MGDYIKSIGAVMMLTSLMKMILPEGSVKKFANLAAGFMLIAVVLSPIKSGIKFEYKYNPQNSVDMEKAEAIYRAEVIKRHKENLCKKISEKIRKNSRVFVETDNNGNITKVTIKSDGDESKAVFYIVNTLGVPRERISVSYENN